MHEATGEARDSALRKGVYFRYSVTHCGAFGKDFVEIEVKEDGSCCYSNSSQYKSTDLIKKECKLSPLVCEHIEEVIVESGILSGRVNDENWPVPVSGGGYQELEIILHESRLSLCTTNIDSHSQVLSLASQMNDADWKGLETFYYLTLQLKGFILDLISLHFKGSPI